MNHGFANHVAPGSNTGVLIPENGGTLPQAPQNEEGGRGELPPAGILDRDIIARWRRMEHRHDQARRFDGHAADLLDWGIDTVHYHIAVDHPTLLSMIGRCRAWVDSGARPDVIEGGINGYSYTILREDGLRIYISSGKNLLMGLWVVGGAGWCLQYEANDLEYQIADAIMNTWDLEPHVLNLKLRRVDLRFDFRGDLLQPYAELGHMICKARTFRKMHDEKIPCESYGTVARWTGVTAGKDDIRARFYDKIAELEQGEKGLLPRWREVWNYSGDSVWRLEYQLRGDFLPEFKVERLGQLVAILGDVRDKLLQWLRFAEQQARKDVDRPLLPWWEAIQETLLALDLAVVGARREVQPRKPDVDALRAQMLGLFASWMAASHFLNGAADWDWMDGVSDFYLEVEKERANLEVKYRDKKSQYRLSAYQ